MPNTGLPSRDCGLCRKRRVKECLLPAGTVEVDFLDAKLIISQCDLARPSCARCLKYGATCPGYRTDHDLFFRNESVISVEGRSRRRQFPTRSRASDTPSSDEDQSNSLSSSLGSAVKNLQSSITPYHQSTPALLLVVNEDWRSHSVPRLIQHFSSALGAGQHDGTHNFFPILLQGAGENSCLRLVTKVFAHSFFKRIHHQESPHDPQDVDMVGRALKSVNAALRHPSECHNDATVVAVWLLSIYEVCPPFPLYIRLTCDGY
jgi:hypothetical protein